MLANISKAFNAVEYTSLQMHPIYAQTKNILLEYTLALVMKCQDQQVVGHIQGLAKLN